MIKINQRAAGSGKTYESIQLINNHNDQIKTYIYLTKTHSAKSVIYEEWKSQQSKGLITDLDLQETVEGKQYIIEYKNKENNIIVIMGTLDSFMYGLVDMQQVVRRGDLFTDIADSISTGNIKKLDNFKWANRYIPLIPSTVILVDEAQDVSIQYLFAMDEIVQRTGLNLHLIGDILQSLHGGVNLLSLIQENGIQLKSQIDTQSKQNTIRRFSDQRLIDLVQYMVPFNKYNIPDLQATESNYRDTEQSLQLIEVNYDQKNIDYITEKVIKQIRYYALKYGYTPRDFLIQFPIIKNNPFAQSLFTNIQQLWINLFKDTDYLDITTDDYWKSQKINNYSKFVYLHRAEEGQAINLAESEYSTRIVSIHTSKGQGRNVSIVMQLTESNIKLFSEKETTQLRKDLVYDSFVHVALTRQKRFLIILVDKCQDDIHTRLLNNGLVIDDSVEMRLQEDVNIQSIRMVEYMDSDTSQQLINYIKEQHLQEQLQNCQQNGLVDYGHHMIQYAVINTRIMFWFAFKRNTESQDRKDQCYAKLKHLSTCYVEKCGIEQYKQYMKQINQNIKDRKPQLGCIKVLIYQQSDKFIHLANIVKQYIEEVIDKVQQIIISNSLDQCQLCPIEMLVLLFVQQLLQKGWNSIISNLDLYYILSNINSYNFQNIHPESTNNQCLCSQLLVQQYNILTAKATDQIRSNSIINHYGLLQKIDDNILKICEYADQLSPNMRTLINHQINIQIESPVKLTIKDQVNFIMFSDTHILIIHQKPLTIIDLIDRIKHAYLQSGMLQLGIMTQENIKRFKGKIVYHAFLQLNQDKPLFVKDLLDVQNIQPIKQCVRTTIFKIYAREHRCIASMYINQGISQLRTYKLQRYVESCVDNLEDNESETPYTEQYIIQKLDDTLQKKLRILQF